MTATAPAAPAAPAAPSPAPRPLACPWCTGPLTFGYVYDGGAYSEHRTVDTIECDTCDATWDATGNQTAAPRWIAHPSLYDPPTEPDPVPLPAGERDCIRCGDTFNLTAGRGIEVPDVGAWCNPCLGLT